MTTICHHFVSVVVAYRVFPYNVIFMGDVVLCNSSIHQKAAEVLQGLASDIPRNSILKSCRELLLRFESVFTQTDAQVCVIS